VEEDEGSRTGGGRREGEGERDGEELKIDGCTDRESSDEEESDLRRSVCDLARTRAALRLRVDGNGRALHNVTGEYQEPARPRKRSETPASAFPQTPTPTESNTAAMAALSMMPSPVMVASSVGSGGQGQLGEDADAEEDDGWNRSVTSSPRPRSSIKSSI
ncbi:unnamed protein product, partial [Choristocarpus tenellus]